MDRDPFDFAPKEAAAETEVERPEGGEDDPALMAPVLAALKTVQDPEIPVDLVELGLIYELIVKKGGLVYVEMTLTTPSCPVAANMPGEVAAAIREVPGVCDVRVKLVWTPPWGQELMSDEARLELRVDVIRPRAVLFDLLSALIDSWTLWDRVAGAAAGRRWRIAYLRNTYAAANYRPYETLVREAAVEVGLPPSVADALLDRYGELEPWPEVGAVLGAFKGHIPIGVVTNCSEALGQIAAARTGIAFDVVVTAERAGFYKPHPRPYRLALEALGAVPETSLFVAGSAYDLLGASTVGMPVFWHDRIGMAPPPEAPPPMARHDTLLPLGRILFD